MHTTQLCGPIETQVCCSYANSAAVWTDRDTGVL